MARNSKSSSVRVNRVRKFSSRFELLESLSPKGLTILKCLGAGNTERDAAKAAQSAKSTVTYWKDKFLTMGLLQLVTRDVFQIFRFTPFGSKLVAGSEGLCRERLVLEDCAVKFAVLDGEKRCLDWVKLGAPRNWVQLGCFVGGVRVERTSNSVIVHPGRLRGFVGDEHELSLLSGRIVEWVRGVLEGRFGMVLDHAGIPLHKPIFRFYSEEAKEDVRHGTVVVEGVGSVDSSPPERVPHEEYNGVERARARLLLPDSVRSLELKVDELRGVISGLVSALKPIEQLTGALERLLPPPAAPEPGPSPSQNTMDKYVI